MRTSGAYVAGFGTAGSLLAGAAIVFVLASAVVEFRGWPQLGFQPSAPAVVVVPSSARAGSRIEKRLVSSARSRGPRVSTVTAGVAGAGRSANVPSGGSAGPGTSFAAAPVVSVPAPALPPRPTRMRIAAPPVTPPAISTGNPAGPATTPCSGCDVSPANSVVGNVVQGATGALGGTVASTGATLGSTVSGVAGALGTTLSGVSPLLGGTVQGAGGAVGGTLSATTGALGGTVSGVGQALGWLLGGHASSP